MQFIEKNSFNVRSAIYQLKKEDSEIEFVLFPMVHIGSEKFYQKVSEKLSQCDLILAEGVNSKKVNFLTISYRVVKFMKRVDLVTQNEGLNFSQFKDKIFNSDICRKDFDKNWTSISFYFRFLLFLFIPFYSFYMMIFGSREIIAKNIATEDLPDSNEIFFQDDKTDKLDEVLIDKRDKILIENIRKAISNNQEVKTRIGILYGAVHMRNIVNYLMNDLNYKIADSEWLVVFDL